MITITPLYAGLLGLLFVYLSSRVIVIRRSDKISLGDGGNKDMRYRIRAHGNWAEYVPIGLILLAMTEMQGAPEWVVHMLGLMLLVGRILHAVGMNLSLRLFSPRVWGMLLTLLMIVLSAVSNIGHALL